MAKRAWPAIVALALGFSLEGVANPSSIPRIISILPLETSGAIVQASDRITLEEELHASADTALTRQGYNVVSAEGTPVAHDDHGTDSTRTCDRTCALLMARDQNAEYFIAPSLTTTDGRMIVLVRLVESKTGILRASMTVTGARIADLLRAIRRRSGVLFRSLLASDSALVTKIEPRSGLEFARIPGGRSDFGCELLDDACRSDEKPSRAFSVSTFWLGRTDVTVAAYARCVSAGQCDEPETGPRCNWHMNGKEDHPINCVDWNQAATFCRWLGGRLPESHEWEYAAKGGENRIYPWGNDRPDRRNACYGLQPGTARAGSYPAAATKQGVLDMAGNVRQWTATNHAEAAQETRGGSCADPAGSLRASSHPAWDPTVRGPEFGFRCALPPSSGASARRWLLQAERVAPASRSVTSRPDGRAADQGARARAGLLGLVGTPADTADVVGPGGTGTALNDAIEAIRTPAANTPTEEPSRGTTDEDEKTNDWCIISGRPDQPDASVDGGTSVDDGHWSSPNCAVSLEVGDTGGGLYADELTSAVRASWYTVKSCFANELGGTRPTLFGRVVVEVTIGPDGAVSESRIQRSDLGDAAIDQCILSTARRWAFPIPRGGNASAIVAVVLAANRPAPGYGLGIGPLGPGGQRRQASGEFDLGGRGRGQTQFRPSMVHVEGGMTADVVGRVIRRHWNETKYCYEKELSRVPGMEGVLSVHFQVNPQGDVTSARVNTSDLHDSNLDECVLRNVRGWKFPGPHDGGETEVDYPYDFRSGR